MRDYLPMMIVGLMMSALSIPNLMGKAASINRYNRRRVRDEDMPSYSRAMGVGTLIMGAGIAVTAALLMIFRLEALFWLAAAGLAAGLAVIIYAQLRYNGGVF